MPELLTRPLLRREEPAWGTRVPWLAAVLGIGWTIAAGFAMCVLPFMAWWIGNGASSSMADPLRFGSWVWLVSHRVGVSLDEGTFDVAPLGLTVLLVLLMYRSARWAAHSAGVDARRGAIMVVASAVVVYGLSAAVMAILATSGEISVQVIEAAATCGLWALLATSAGVGVESGLLSRQSLRVPREAVVALRAGVMATGGLLACGAVLVVVSVLANAGRIGELGGSLGAGGLGTVLLVIASLAYLPNAVVWGSAFALGPGFAFGVGTSVSPAGVDLGLVPALPLLGALPSSVSSMAWITVIGPLLVGAATAYVVHRELDESVPTARAVATGFGAGGVAMLAMAIASAMSAGSAGSTRLTVIGPVSGQVALTTLLVIGVMAAGGVVLIRTAQQLRTDTADDDGDSAGIEVAAGPVGDE